MDYEKIKLATLSVYQKFGIKSFPVDCMEILQSYGMKVETYAQQKPAKYKMCLTYTSDAFSLKKKVYYNDTKSIGRIRFSLAHEIGHIALHHSLPRTQEQEDEADCFASYFLAPRMAIHYAGCKNQNDVAKLFNMSHEAALYAFNDYRRWHRWTVYHKMNDFDKAMYQHFYNEKQDCFVYSIRKCNDCSAVIYNSPYETCKSEKCNKVAFINFGADRDLIAAENNWLYGGL